MPALDAFRDLIAAIAAAGVLAAAVAALAMQRDAERRKSSSQ